MTPTINSRKYCIFFLSISLLTRRAWCILQLISIYPCLKYWSNSNYFTYGNCIPRICTSLRTNKFLSCNSNYKPSIRNPIYWPKNRSMAMRWLCCKKCNSSTIFCTPFYLTICNRRYISNPHSLPSPNRLK